MMCKNAVLSRGKADSAKAEMKKARAQSSKRSQRGTLKPMHWPVSPATQEAESGIVRI